MNPPEITTPAFASEFFFHLLLVENVLQREYGARLAVG